MSESDRRPRRRGAVDAEPLPSSRMRSPGSGTEVPADLSAFAPRLALSLGPERPRVHEVDGTLVFADLSGFTAMSERLSRLGRLGSEEVSDLVSATFATLLAEASDFGGALLSFGGDALLLSFAGPHHASRGVRAAARMRRSLRTVGLLETSAGRVRLRMSIGVHSGALRFLVVGASSATLVVAGPHATAVVEAEASARAGQIVISAATAALLPPSSVGAPCGCGALLARAPSARPVVPPPVPADSGGGAEFLSTALRDHLERGGTDSEHRQAGVAFAIVDGCDAVVAEGGYSELVARLDQVVGIVQQASDEHGVCLLSSDVHRDGVKLLLTSGVPSAHGADEERLLQAVGAFMAADLDLPVRVGVHAGAVFAGVVGSSFGRTYTVMGDVVNTAARVAGAAQAGEILVTPEVLDRCATTYALTPMTPFAAKGKAAPVHVARLGPPLGRRTAGTASDGSLPLLERRAQLEELLSHLDTTGCGAGVAIALVAPSGSGTTRLLDEAAAARPELRWLRTTASSADAAAPFASVRPLLRAALGLPPAPDPADGPVLRVLVQQMAPDALPWLPLVATAVGAAVEPTPEADALEPRERQPRLRAVVGGILLAALDTPTVLVLEHLGHADASSAQLLEGLVGRLIRRPVAVVTAGEHPPGWPAEQIDLPPLSHRAGVDLAVLAGGGRVLAHQGAAVAHRAAGLPRLVVELAAVVARGADEDALPVGVEQVAAASLDALEPSLRAATRALSVLGPVFPIDRADMVLGAEAPDVLARLHGLIDIGPDRIARFRSAVLREAAHQGLPHRRRTELHGLVADALASSANAEAMADALALHAFEARRDDLSWRWGSVAAERAWAAGAAAEAANHLRRALRAARRLPHLSEDELGAAWGLLGTALWSIGDPQGAQEPFRHALRLVRDRVERATLRLRAGLTAEELGRPLAAARRYRQGLRELEGLTGAAAGKTSARLDLALGHLQLRRGHTRQALEIFEDVLDRTKVAGDVYGVAHAHHYAAMALGQLGRSEAVERSRLALQAFEEHGHPRAIGAAYVNLGVAIECTGDVLGEEAAFERAVRIFEESGDATLEAVARLNLSEVHRRLGILDSAEQHATSATAVLRAAGSSYAQDAELRLAKVRVAQGRAAEAPMLPQEHGVRWTDPQYREELLTLRAAIALARSAPQEAIAELDGVSTNEASVLRVRALVASGEPSAARTAAEDAIRQAKSTGNRFDELMSLIALRTIAPSPVIDSNIRCLQQELGLVRLPPLPGPPG